MSGFTHAFRLSKQEVAEATPPGTFRLVDRGHNEKAHAIHEETRRSDEIILVPAPSSDPWDPLTWPTWRKTSILICMSVFAFIGNFTSSSISSTLPLYATPLAFNPPEPFSRLSRLIAINALFQGCGSILTVPLANTFGKRPVTLICLLILTFTSMWAGLAKTYDSLFLARLFMGIGISPSETVSPDVLGEIYYTHQRGRAIGVYTIFLVLGSLMGGLTGGYIAANGLAWIHWVNVIITAATFVACFFLQPETLFNRETAYARELQIMEERTAMDAASDKAGRLMRTMTTATTQSGYKDFTYLASLKIGTYRRGVLLRNFVAPFKTLRLPGVWLVMLWYAGLLGGIVTISVVGPQILSAPPYLWGKNAGLINVGGIIGAFIGAFFTVLLVDRVMARKARKNNTGVTEAEDRLPIALPGLILSVAGTWAFGFSAQTGNPNAWIGMQFGLGMLSAGLMQAPSVGFSYIIDAYPTIAADCFVAVTCMRAVVAFAFTFFVGEWVTTAGPAIPFGVFGGIMGFFASLVIPIYFFGKRIRIATAKWVPQAWAF